MKKRATEVNDDIYSALENRGWVLDWDSLDNSDGLDMVASHPSFPNQQLYIYFGELQNQFSWMLQDITSVEAPDIAEGEGTASLLEYLMNTESSNSTAKSAVEGNMSTEKKSSREALREKIAAKKGRHDYNDDGSHSSDCKWCAKMEDDQRPVKKEDKKAGYERLRQVAAEEPNEVDAALAELGESLGTMADALTALRENLDLIDAPKTAALKVRIASRRKYASKFRQIAEQAPEVLVDALNEVYNSLDEIAAGVENLAEHMGVELHGSEVMEEFAEEGKEELAEAEAEGESVDEQIHEEAEGLDGHGEADLDASEEEEEEIVEGEEDEPVEKEAAAGSDYFVTDRDNSGAPQAPQKVDRSDTQVKITS